MARLTSIGLSNFKSIGAAEQNLTLAPITLLFGPNSAGKSTVLQALIYLREIIHKRNLNPDHTELGGSWLDLGGFQNLVHGHDLSNSIIFDIGMELEAEELPSYLSDFEQANLDEGGLPGVSDFFSELNHASLRLELQWSASLGRVLIASFQSSLNGKTIATIKSSPDGRQINIEHMPMLYDGFHAPVEAFGENVSLVQLLDQLFKASMLDRGPTNLVDDRPFKNSLIEELENRVHSDDIPARQLLQKIKSELTFRSSRRAHALEKEVDKLLQSQETASVIEFLGLHGQSDAMPNAELGLSFDPEIWSDPEDGQEDIVQMQRHLATAVINMAICGPLHCLSEWLGELSYIGPLRDLPPRNIQPRSTPDKSRWAKGLAAWELLPTAKTSLVDEINFWLGEDCLNSGYQLLVKKFRELEDSHPIYRMLENELDEDDQEVVRELLEELPHNVRVCLKEQSSDLEVMPQDIGVGISQLFPVIALSVIQKRGLAAIEQPELHIHPRLQVEMADIFVRYATESNVMFLLETHSEHLMLRLLRRVRQASDPDLPDDLVTLQPNDLAVHYVEPADTGTQFKQLRISEDGDFIDEWPHGFFDERDEELFF